MFSVGCELVDKFPQSIVLFESQFIEMMPRVADTGYSETKRNAVYFFGALYSQGGQAAQQAKQ